MSKPAPGTEPDYNARIGDLVGNYRLERIIDQGGMGVVFYAVHKDIGRPAAVKILFRHFAADASFSTRFLNEAKAVNFIRHPGIVETFEFGKLDDETPYIIMEFLDGESIAARLQKGRPSLLEALSWSRQIALAVAAGHEKGIIHRDLKPENIVLLKDPLLPGFERTKILDFGIAKVDPSRLVTNLNGAITAQKGAALTQVGMTLGSPLYMPPEQYQELAAVTDRGDVYSLGVILYELLAGKVPFYADGALAVMAMHLRTPPPPLRDIDPTLPEPVIALVLSMLEKSPAARPSMAEVETRLSGLLQEAELQAQLKNSHSMPSLSAGTLSGLFQLQLRQAAQAQAPPPPPQSRWLRSGIAAVASLAVMLLVAFAVFRSRPPKPSPPPLLVVTATPTPAPESTTPKAPPEPTTVSISVTTDPAGARIICSETGRELGVTPVTLELPYDKRALPVVLRRSGFRDRSLVLDRSRNGVQSTRLDAVPQRAKTSDSLLTPSFE
jgi:serine/threonine protein kinase